MLRQAARHAGGRYRQLFGWFRRAEAEVQHLHDVEHLGESAETPFIAIAGLILFLLPIFLVMVGAAFAAYYLAR